MSVDPESSPQSLTFTYRPDELETYNRLAFARQVPDAGNTFFGLILLAVFVIGLAVFAAAQLGLFPAAHVGSVLAAAYVAFFAGAAALHGWWRIHFRQIARKMGAESKYSGSPYEVACDASGIACRGAGSEARVTWRAIERVVSYDTLVVIWLDVAQGLAVPTRIFASDAARRAFIAAVNARIQAAKAATT